MKKLFTLFALIVVCGVAYGQSSNISYQSLNLKLQQLNNLCSHFGFSVSNGQLKIIALVDSETQFKGNFYLIPLTRECKTSMSYFNGPDQLSDGYYETFTYHIHSRENDPAEGGEEGGGAFYRHSTYYGQVTNEYINSIKIELGPNFDKAKGIYLILNDILKVNY